MITLRSQLGLIRIEWILITAVTNRVTVCKTIEKIIDPEPVARSESQPNVGERAKALPYTPS